MQTAWGYAVAPSDGSLDFDFSYFCHGEGLPGNPLVPCDGDAHRSQFKLTVTGSQSMGTIAMNGIDRFVDWEIRDLMLNKARFRGQDALELNTEVTTDGELAGYLVELGATYDQVRYLAGQEVPTFGTIDFALQVGRTRGTTRASGLPSFRTTTSS